MLPHRRSGAVRWRPWGSVSRPDTIDRLSGRGTLVDPDPFWRHDAVGLREPEV
jgi:hypothetical protein